MIFDPGTALGIAYRPVTMGDVVRQCFVAGGIAGARYNMDKHDFADQIKPKTPESADPLLSSPIEFPIEIKGRFEAF